MILVRKVAPHGSIRHVRRRPEQQITENHSELPRWWQLVHVFRKRFPLTDRDQQFFKERELMYARISALLVAFALAVTSLAAAQERFGNITGKVTDQTGAVLPGVTVTVTNNETQRSTVVVSDANGTFYATALDPGRYTVKFELSGFITQEAPSVILLLGTTATVDSSLRVGGAHRDRAGPRRHAAHRRGARPLIRRTSRLKSSKPCRRAAASRRWRLRCRR